MRENQLHIKQRIANSIHTTRKSTLVNHFRTAAFFEYKPYLGTETKDGFQVWHCSGVSRFLYPVIHINFSNPVDELRITTSLNSVGKLVSILLICLISVFFANLFVLGKDLDGLTIFKRVMFIVFLDVLILLMTYLTYRADAKRELKLFDQLIKNG